MEDPAEPALVIEALTCALSNTVELKDSRTAERIRNTPELRGLTPEGIKRELREFVRHCGGQVEQRCETREE